AGPARPPSDARHPLRRHGGDLRREPARPGVAAVPGHRGRAPADRPARPDAADARRRRVLHRVGRRTPRTQPAGKPGGPHPDAGRVRSRAGPGPPSPLDGRPAPPRRATAPPAAPPPRPPRRPDAPPPPPP